MTDELQYSRIEPSYKLTKVINYYWHMECDDHVQEIPDLLIPDGYVEIIFALAGGYHKRAIDENSDILKVNQSSIIGLQNQSHLVKRMGTVRLIGIKISPIGYYQLFGEVAPITPSNITAIGDTKIKLLKLAENDLAKLKDTQRIVDYLNHMFLSRLSVSISQNMSIVSKAFDTILKSKGNIKIEDLAHDHNLSTKQLERHFKKYIGRSPKYVCNIIRFKHIYKHYILSSTQASNYFDLGYYDQSHFIRDFKKYTGITPGAVNSEHFLESTEISRKSTKSA